MKSFVVKEVVNHYHKVMIDDELDIEQLIQSSDKYKSSTNAGYVGLNNILKVYKKAYGFKYSIKPNYCGIETVCMEAMGCDDDSPELD